jgi:hypothetical protein
MFSIHVREDKQMRNTYITLVTNNERQKAAGTYWCQWKDSIKMNLEKEIY